MPAKKKNVRVVIDAYGILEDIVGKAAERACNRHDKYSDEPLSEASRALLINEFSGSFWLAVDDACVDFKI